MGCGSSVAEKDQIKVIPAEALESTPAPAIHQAPKTEVKGESVANKTQPATDKKTQNSSPAQKKDLTSSTITKKDADKNARSDSKANLGKSGGDLRSSSITKPIQTPSKDESPSKGKQELRESSLTKSSSKLKGKEDLSKSKTKADNPERETDKVKLTESVIQEESEMRATKKEKEKTIKKIKSVKNNKELTDLIKVYGL